MNVQNWWGSFGLEMSAADRSSQILQMEALKYVQYLNATLKMASCHDGTLSQNMKTTRCSWNSLQLPLCRVSGSCQSHTGAVFKAGLQKICRPRNQSLRLPYSPAAFSNTVMAYFDHHEEKTSFFLWNKSPTITWKNAFHPPPFMPGESMCTLEEKKWAFKGL